MSEYCMSDASADAGANAGADAFANDVTDDCTHAVADFGTDVESDERAECIADAEPDICAHAGADAIANAAAANSLCVERVRQMGTVLEDVRRRCAVADKIHRDRTGARRQRMRSFDLPAPVQQFCVYVQPGDIFELWCVQCMYGFVWQSGHQVSDAHFQRSLVHRSEAC